MGITYRGIGIARPVTVWARKAFRAECACNVYVHRYIALSAHAQCIRVHVQRRTRTCMPAHVCTRTHDQYVGANIGVNIELGIGSDTDIGNADIGMDMEIDSKRMSVDNDIRNVSMGIGTTCIEIDVDIVALALKSAKKLALADTGIAHWHVAGCVIYIYICRTYC